MAEQNFEFKIEPKDGEVIIRQGTALNVYDPVPVNLSGTITAPADYATWELDRLMVIAARISDVSITDSPAAFAAPLEGLVIANYTARTIALTTKPREKFGGAKVTGTLSLDPRLAAFQINEKKSYDKDGLYDLIKFAGAYFSNRDAHGALLGQLKKFDAKIAQVMKDADDFKGAKALEYTTNIATNLSLQFALGIPIWAGGEATEINVEICVGLKNGLPDFWLESTDLHEKVIVETETIFERELKRLKQFAIIKQY